MGVGGLARSHYVYLVHLNLLARLVGEASLLDCDISDAHLDYALLSLRLVK